MATTDRPAAGNATALATTLREADLCHLVVRATGDAVAGATLLVAACEAVSTPYHVSAVRTRGDLEARVAGVDEAADAVVLGASVQDVPSIEGGTSAGRRAYEVATELGADPDPVLALAGAVSRGELPGDDPSRAYDDADLDRRPGVASPTDDPVDGLAYTTLVHGEYSGRPDAAREAIDGRDEDGEALDRRVASLLAVAVAGDPDGSRRGAESVERALRPHGIDGPVETLEGYADVLSALAVERPGLAVALGLGNVEPAAAIDVWRQHAGEAHRAVRSATTARHDGLVVSRVEGPVGTAARLLRDFRSSEPVVLAVDETSGEAAIADVEDGAGAALEAAVDGIDGDALGSGETGFSRDVAPDELVAALRREL